MMMQLPYAEGGQGGMDGSCSQPQTALEGVQGS